MKKQRLVEKDYSRLSRTKGIDGKKRQGSQGNSNSVGTEVSVLEEFEQIGTKQERERLLRRWSPKSIRQEARSMGWKPGLNQVRKSVNRGKFERDRGLRLKEENLDRKKTGMYTRVGVKSVSGKRRLKDREGLDRILGRKIRPTRRGIGRQEKGQRKWLGEFQGVNKPRGESERQIRREGVKGRGSISKGSSVIAGLKTLYQRMRRKRLRIQIMSRSRVRVGQEKTKGKASE